MSAPRIVAFSGNLRRPSRSRSLVEALARELGRRIAVRVETYDILDLGPGFGASLDAASLPEAARAILRSVEEADGLIVGTPVYKGSYTGLFKHFFDFARPESLAGKPVALTAVGGGARHALMVEHALRPLFGFFTAMTLPTALCAAESDVTDGELTDPAGLVRLSAMANEMAGLLTSRPALTVGRPADGELAGRPSLALVGGRR